MKLLKGFRMKKLLIPIIIVAFIIAFYGLSLPQKNNYITIIGFVIFMIGVMKLSTKVPSKNQEKEDEDV